MENVFVALHSLASSFYPGKFRPGGKPLSEHTP